jgi:hypothetical protein
MSTSTFLQLNSYTLVEFQYTSLATPEKQDFDFIKIVSADGTIQILNIDGAKNTTGNVRDLSAVKTLTGSYADLNKDITPNYTSAVNLVTTTINGSSTPYDKVLFHFLAGYNFEDIEGVILKIEAPERSGKLMTYASIVLTKSNVADLLDINAKPIWIRDRLYNRTFTVMIPATKIINDEYLSLAGNPNQNLSLASLFTSDGTGFQKASPLRITALDIESISTTTINSVDYKIYNTSKVKTISVKQIDEFGLLSAVINESTAGDYFEYYASWNGGFIEDYISQANQLHNNDYIVIHDLKIFEQVGNSYIKSAELTTIQESDFDKPMEYRPIIKNANKAFSFTIDYTLRLYNKADSTQILRLSSVSSYNAKKWGRKLAKLDIIGKPSSHKIYNKIVDGPTVKNIINNVQIKQVVRYIPSYIDKNQIVIGQSSTSVDGGIAYGQGDLSVHVTPFDNVYSFSVFEKDTTGNIAHTDLRTGDEFYMVFVDNSGNKLRIKRETSPSAGELSNGNLVFKIATVNSEKILLFNTREFYITSVTNNQETILYRGKYLRPDEQTPVLTGIPIANTTTVKKDATVIQPEPPISNKSIVSQINPIK